VEIDLKDFLPSRSTITRMKIVGWFPSIICMLTVVIGFALTTLISINSNTFSLSYRIVDSIVPLFFGLQAAFLLSPETEPSLEILLSTKFPISKVLWERFFFLLLFEGAVAFSGNLISTIFITDGQGILSDVARWIPACVFIGGTAIYTTLVTRQGIFGALLALLMWGGMLIGMDSLLIRFPFLWPIHVYLQLDQISILNYIINRFSLIVLGFLLIIFATYLAKNEERMLGLDGGKK